MKKCCVYCNKILTDRKLKYCNDHCKYWFLAIKNDKFKSTSISQSLRMLKAGRKQMAGKVGCRYN